MLLVVKMAAMASVATAAGSRADLGDAPDLFDEDLGARVCEDEAGAGGGSDNCVGDCETYTTARATRG